MRPARRIGGARRALRAAVILGIVLAAARCGESGRSSPRPRSSLASADGTWTRWRATAQRTGYQGMPGRIANPAILWRAPIGGVIQEEEAVVCSRSATKLDQDLLVVSPSGRLRAFTMGGKPVWERRLKSAVRLLACIDPAGDGNARILAATQGVSGAKLFLFEAKGGREAWESPAGTGGIGAVKLAPLSGTARDLLWLPAASDTLTAFEFLPGTDAPRTRWTSRLVNFTSDPYSSSSVVVARVPPERVEVIVTGARGQVLTVRLDALTGHEISRTSFQPTGPKHGYESGGAGELVQIVSPASRAALSVVTVSNYPSVQDYMFQGITVASLESPTRSRSLDTHPAGLHAVDGSVEASGRGVLELIASRWDPGKRRHELEALTLDSLRVRASQPDFHLLAVVADGRGRLLVGRTGVKEETPDGNERMASLTYRAGAFHRAWTGPIHVRMASPAVRYIENATTDNGGPAAVVSYGSPSELLVFLRLAPTREDVCWLSLADGRIGRCYSPGAGIVPRLLGVRRSGRRVDGLVLSGNDGSMHFLDGTLMRVGSAAAGGYFRSFALNGHGTEIAVVGPLDERGENEVVLVDSRNRIFRLSGVREATPSRPPSLEAIADPSGSQDLLLMPRGKKEHGLVIRFASAAKPALALVDRGGRELWRHDIEKAGGPIDSAFPNGLNTGRFGGGGPSDLVGSFGVPGSSTGHICAIDGVLGKTLWCASRGAFWDAALAVADLDADGLDDVAFNFNNQKALTVSGRDGSRLGEPGVLPQYRNLGFVDYNGAPILIGPGKDGLQMVVIGEDNAHLSVLSLRPGVPPAPRAAVPLWNVEQVRLDDQRDSMPAAAPGTAASGVVLGVGSRSGVLEARRSEDGSLLWRHTLFDGAETNKSRDNALSSVLALDADGNGLVDFVVGGFDGWLYAFEAVTGRRLWTIDLGAPLGDPIAADVDGNGSSTILVPAADGSLYAIGPAK